MKKKYGRVVLIHGIRVSRKNRNMHKLAAAFRAAGFCVVIPRYGYLPAFLVGVFAWLDRRIANSISAFIQENDILLGHSNGATLVYLISQDTPLKGAILLNAALENNMIPNANFVHVYFNAGDVVTKLSAILPFHPWGGMGWTGYIGREKHVTNIDQGNPPTMLAGRTLNLPRLNGHSDVFRAQHVRPWAKFMAELCLQDVLRNKGGS